MYLVDKIIEKCEGSLNGWRQGASGGKSLDIHQKDYDLCGKSKLVEEAVELRDRGLIKIKWQIRGSDVETIFYRLENMDRFYDLRKEQAEESDQTNLTPKYKVIRAYQEAVNQELEVIHSDWIRSYYQEILMKLEKGKIEDILKKKDEYFPCFRGIDELRDPMFKRVFSRKYLHNSKVFETKLQSHVITVAKRYHNEVEDEMDKTQALSQLFIEEYSQELSLKGPLYISIEGNEPGKESRRLNLGDYFYGTVLNSETMKYAVIEEDQPKLKRVVTIENKANFMSAPYREDTLYIFTHGYFSPREREFLQRLEKVLRGKEVEFYHSGDLDYGGIKIFEYIQKRIFGKLKPWMMDVDTYVHFLEYGETIEKPTLEKLIGTKVPELQLLINKILEEKKGIEQESFLL